MQWKDWYIVVVQLISQVEQVREMIHEYIEFTIEVQATRN